MKLRWRTQGVCALLLFSAAGCHKASPPPPAPVAIAPPLNPSNITVITPLPSIPPEPSADVKPAPPAPPPSAPAPKPANQIRRRRKKAAPSTVAATETQSAPAGAATNAVTSQPGASSPAASAPAAQASSQPVALTGSSEVPPAAQTATAAASAEAAPALGELSTGTSISGVEKNRLLSDITEQEHHLAKIKEPSGQDGQALQLQARAFLTKARQAVAENDLDGAKNLTTKARVLLDELQSD